MTRLTTLATAAATCLAVLTGWAALCRWLTTDKPTEADMAREMDAS